MATEPTSNDPAATLKKGVASLLNSDEFSDFTFTCKDKVFKAHKAVVCPQSRFFYNACKKNTFKVGQKRPREIPAVHTLTHLCSSIPQAVQNTDLLEESETGNVDLSHDDPAAVEAMYRYFYKCDYSELAKENPNAMLLHVHVYCLAHKYDIEALKSMAAKQFEDKAKTETIDAASFTPIVKDIYDNTDSKDELLRPASVKIAIENRVAIFKSDGGEFADMMEEIAAFGKDVFKAMSTDSLVAFRCPAQIYHFRIDMKAGSENYRHNPVCPYCALQHLVKLEPAQVACVTFVKQTCSCCRKVLECDPHASTVPKLWCAWCHGKKKFLGA
ncbi:Leptomycin B resistance protein pmd1 [Venturia inaequalis]|nr:Leptomycin B resistance protein pmd1 [Venturia inaequalis]